MKHTLLITTILFVFSIHAQELPKARKIQNSFYLAGGGFSQSSYRKYSGWSSAIGYQVYFPNRFIFGIEYLMEQSAFKEMNGSAIDNTFQRRVKAQSGTVHLGVQIFRKEHFDLSAMITPGLNYQKYITKSYDEEIGEYTFREHVNGYILLPLLAYRLEFFYKFNQLHSIGFTLDGGVGTEDLMSGLLGLGRGMFHYRFTIPNR